MMSEIKFFFHSIDFCLVPMVTSGFLFVQCYQNLLSKCFTIMQIFDNNHAKISSGFIEILVLLHFGVVDAV